MATAAERPGLLRLAARHTGWLIATRTRLARRRGVAGSLLAAVVALGALTSAAYAGTSLLILAAPGVSTPTGRQALSVLDSIQRGSLTGAFGDVLGGLLVAAILNPFAGATLNGLVADEDLLTVAPTRMHAYTDSLVTAAVSPIGVAQLVMLTGLSSLLAVDGGRLPALVAAWSVYPAMIALTVMIGWVLEYCNRRLGRRTRRISLAIVFTTLISVGSFAPASRRLFGLADLFARDVRAAAAGDWRVIVLHVGVLVIATTLTVTVGYQMCSRALARPPLPAVPAAAGRVRRHLPEWLMRHGGGALTAVVTVAALRIRMVRRPLQVIAVVSLPAALLHPEARHSLLQVADGVLPACVCLAWPVNSFGLLGPSLPWLAAQPGLSRRLPAAIISAHQVTTAVLLAVLLVPTTLVHPRQMAPLLPRLLLGAAAATALLSVFALNSALRKPHLARLAGRGDTIVPLVVGIGATVRYVVIAQAGAAVALLHGWMLATGVALVGALVAVMASRAMGYWRRPDSLARIIAVVAPT